MFKFYRWDTGDLIAEAEAETLKAALEKLVADGKYLYRARLDGARLDGASLVGASLDGASLDGASLVGARLDGASLDGARLDGASLDFIKHDLWGVLLHTRNEVPGLVAALQEGRVDGSVYEGECACLVGTLANVRHCKHTEIPGLKPDSGRPSEVWFMGIAKGDTAEKNQIVKITLDWIAEFQALLAPEAVKA
jgi:hypothetical protein